MRLHGVSADEVAQQLGHRKLGITGIYTEYDPQYLSAACQALDELTCQILASAGKPDPRKSLGNLVLPVRIELTTSPLPRECSTTELRQPASRGACYTQEARAAQRALADFAGPR